MTLPTAPELAAYLSRRPVLEHPALPGRRNHLRAGVLVPLVWGDHGLSCVLTLRTRSLRLHGGEVSFPGGRPEPEDRGLEGTAVRETREEIGVTPRRLLGRLASMPLYTSDFRLEPFVGELTSVPAHPASPAEVARILTVDLGALLAEPVLEAVGGDTRGWDLPVFRADGWVVYGATALTLYEMLAVVAEVAGRPVPPLRPGTLTMADLFARGASAGRPRDVPGDPAA